jgi:cytochrome c peroxidase
MTSTTNTRTRFAAATLMLAIAAVTANAQVFPPDMPAAPGPLGNVQVPLPKNLSDYVLDMNAAKVLGKAFFWDQQAGSDGLACASCHFQAGADNRVKNQIDPSLRNTDAKKNGVWQRPASSTGGTWTGGPNYTLAQADFPFHKLANTADRNSAVQYDTFNVVSSQGVFRADFNSINLAPKKKQAEVCSSAISPTFSIGGINTRQVEPRNTPTVINAIFNFRNFWDGRANNIFNGRNPFGYRDPTAGIDPLNSILVADLVTGALTPFPVALADASLASQAVGPPGSNLEMSCSGRLFENIGQKMLAAAPLSSQTVDSTDSLLGPYAGKHGGLNTTYAALIQKAFNPKFWISTKLSPDGYTQMQKNFSLFWGVSIMLYESTLVSDQTPFDKYYSGDQSAMTTQQVTGFLGVFMGKGGCIFCHKGAEFTGAATSLQGLRDTGGLIEHMIMGDGSVALYDSGFYNIGVRPASDDVGAAGLDPWNNPLNWSRQAKNALAVDLSLAPQYTLFGLGQDKVDVFTCNFQVAPCFPVSATERDTVDGSFKVPTLRNVELTGPYFHNGGQATLEQVVDFYARGGDGAGDEFTNTTGFHNTSSGLLPAGTASNYTTNRAPAIFPLPLLTPTDKANLVAFLKALTDDRVRWEKAPFDHPSLSVPNGQKGDQLKVNKDGSNKEYAVDDNLNIPAVGAAGRSKQQGALQPFAAGLK